MEPWITTPGCYRLSDHEYHADPVVGGSLSSTGARTLISQTPARFKWEQQHGPTHSDVFDFGRATHAVVLGKGAPIVEIDSEDWRPRKAREQRDQARAEGHIPILAKNLACVREMAQKLLEHPIARPLMDRPGDAETAWVARDPVTGVMCRALVDWIPHTTFGERTLIVDYKTTEDASPQGFAKSVANFGYHQQADWYRQVVSLVRPEWPDPRFVFVAQEKRPPYLVSVVELSARALAWGRVLNYEARELYQQCVDTDRWPGYEQHQSPDGGVPVMDLPYWQERQLTDRFGPLDEFVEGF